ncbi:MAG: InlB B-repeat-containing protein [Bacilli bacterium]|nr:InlB B-repeat-containing protein [Bacilli bacterium]
MKLKNLFRTLGIALLIPTVAACSFVRAEDNSALGIKEVTWVYDKDGNVVVTITYTDEEKPADEFVVPKGVAGEDGISIQDITPNIDPVTQITTITITYTDPNKPVTEVEVPSGRGIKEIKQEDDGLGNIVLTIEFTDGTFFGPITIYKGATGNGIDEIKDKLNADGSVELTIEYTNGGDPKVITIPKPKEGNGISYVETSSDDYHYYLIIHYTDPDKDDDIATFDKPPVWTTVNAKPKDSEGRIGDYAFDIDHDIIYTKVKENEDDEVGYWIVAVSFATEEATYEVKFDLNTPEAPYATRISGNASYNIKHGRTFYSYNYDLPVAIREGYTFGGWSTKPLHNPAVNGIFTDLTPVICAMTLYAVWTLN